MTTTKGNGPDAANIRPAKKQTKYATDFIGCTGQLAQLAQLAHVLNVEQVEQHDEQVGKIRRCDSIHATPEMGPVHKNIVSDNGAFTHALSWVFSRQEFFDTGFPVSHGFRRDGLVRKACRMALSMFLTSRHLCA